MFIWKNCYKLFEEDLINVNVFIFIQRSTFVMKHSCKKKLQSRARTIGNEIMNIGKWPGKVHKITGELHQLDEGNVSLTVTISF